MIDPTVRTAQIHDLAELNRLENEAREALIAARGGARLLEMLPLRSNHWFEAGIEVLVADLDGLCVGYLVGVPGEIWKVEIVYVMPQAREVGFGDALLEMAMDSARGSGARRFEAIALPGDRETKNLYERAGVTAKAITVAVELSGPSSEVPSSR